MASAWSTAPLNPSTLRINPISPTNPTNPINPISPTSPISSEQPTSKPSNPESRGLVFGVAGLRYLAWGRRAFRQECAV